MQPFIIYILRDPETSEVRYVGVTTLTIKRRLQHHIYEAKGNKDESRKNNWVRSLLRRDLRPVIEQIEETSDSYREEYWISYYRETGASLTNHARGGIYLRGPSAGLPKYRDITNERFSRLVAVKVVSRIPVIWLFRCDCGKDFICKGTSVTSGKTRSCGCLLQESTKKNGATSNKKHGKWKSSEFVTWSQIRAKCRCSNHKDFKNFGARGIKVCAEWDESFERFLADMGPRPENSYLLRKDIESGFNPENCFWGSSSERSKKVAERKRKRLDESNVN